MGLALHRLLTSEFGLADSPLSRAILGAKELRSEVGAESPRYLWADEVREISAALSALKGRDPRDRRDPSGLKAAWPRTPVSDRDINEHVFQELEGHFRELAAHYRTAAARGNAMLIDRI